MRLAHISNLIPTTASDVLRATTENYALDSYQNLIFSIARFHEYTGRKDLIIKKFDAISYWKSAYFTVRSQEVTHLKCHRQTKNADGQPVEQGSRLPVWR